MCLYLLVFQNRGINSLLQVMLTHFPTCFLGYLSIIRFCQNCQHSQGILLSQTSPPSGFIPNRSLVMPSFQTLNLINCIHNFMKLESVLTVLLLLALRVLGQCSKGMLHPFTLRINTILGVSCTLKFFLHSFYRILLLAFVSFVMSSNFFFQLFLYTIL